MDLRDRLPAAVLRSASERKLATGQALFCRGDRSVGVYEVVHGTVRLVRGDAAGREVVIRMVGVGDTIAEASLFAPTYDCDAIATTQAVVRVYPKAAVLAQFARDPQAAQAFMAMLARQILDLRTRLEWRSMPSARDRVRHYLVADSKGGIVVLPGTVKDLAGELGLTHEALYRTLAQMQADGEIARRKGEIRIASPAHDRDHM